MDVESGNGASFGELLRRHRLAAGVTQEELADASGLSVRALADMERGRTGRPYRRSVASLAQAMGLCGRELAAFVSSARAGIPRDGGKGDCGARGPDGRKGVMPRQLPRAVCNFTGRTAELEALDQFLERPEADGEAAAIAVIAGAAGVGKSALAVHWSHRAMPRFPDGQLYVDLRGFDQCEAPLTPQAAIRMFLEALPISFSQIPADLDAQVGLYRSLLAGRAMLVVLDNARDCDQVRPLLPGSSRCLAVVTSRSQLAGLVATAGASLLQLDVLAQSQALALLVSRLGIERVAAESQAARRIADRCAGLPLALSIVAAHVATRPGSSLAWLDQELQHSRNVLDVLGSSDVASDLRAVFSWSYRLLSPPAARMFRLLGLHPGPELSTGAAACVAGVSRDQACRLLRELAGLHLVSEPEPGRFVFNDLIRAYAGDLATGDEKRAVHVNGMDPESEGPCAA